MMINCSACGGIITTPRCTPPCTLVVQCGWCGQQERVIRDIELPWDMVPERPQDDPEAAAKGGPWRRTLEEMWQRRTTAEGDSKKQVGGKAVVMRMPPDWRP